MQKKYVRIAGSALDLEPLESSFHVRTDHPGIVPGSWIFPEFEGKASPEVLSDLKAGLENGLLNQNPDPLASELKDIISAYIGQPPELIGCYPGETAAMGYIARTFLEPGTEMVVTGPAPNDRLIAAISTGASIVEVNHPDPLSPGIEPVIDNIGKRTRLILIGNPSPLIGSHFTEAELVFLLAYAEQAMIVVDESYFEFSGFSSAEFVRRFPNLTIIRSLTRAFGLDGLRASYVISDSENISYYSRLGTGDGIDAVAQAAAISALNHIDHTRDYIAQVDEAKKNLSATLPQIGYDFYIAPADFFILKVSDAEGTCLQLADEGISSRDLKEVRGMEGYIRIGIGDPEKIENLLLALSRIARSSATGLNHNRIAAPVKIQGRKTADSAS